MEISNATVEREVRETYAAELTPNEVYPYPFYSACGLHWLAHYNLAMQLPTRSSKDPGTQSHRHITLHGSGRLGLSIESVNP
ncbi:MAG: hypothetical protein RSE32_16915 [Comamonas sp.]|uniref:hypothetical protein n=1 Tax=Comamonas sp. TaxID=34028 RepID=UPI002FC7FFFF